MSINHEDVQYLIEVRGIYDGWSVALMNDGTYVNRWEQDDRRYQPTQDYMRMNGWIE